MWLYVQGLSSVLSGSLEDFQGRFGENLFELHKFLTVLCLVNFCKLFDNFLIASISTGSRRT